MTWLTARELAGLPGMPGTEFRTRAKLTKLGIPSRPRTGRGGGQEFDCTALPQETRLALMIERVSQAGAAIAAHDEAKLPALTATTPVATSQPARKMPALADKAVADARLMLVNELLTLEGLHGVKKSAEILALQLATGECTPELRAIARTANQRARDDSVSPRTLHRWLSLYRKNHWWGLLPSPAEPAPVATVADDVAAVLGLYLSKDARFRNLTDAAQLVTRQLGREFDTWQQLYARARRALPKVDPVQVIKSRNSGSDAKALLPHKRRDVTALRPLDVFIADGHSLKAKVRHPEHGAPFVPEVTAVFDVATHLWVGWSASLSESTIAVGDALRHAVGNYGVPAIIYSDNGAGQTGKTLDCPIAGVIVRMGAEHHTGIPGNPQGRGLIEGNWKGTLLKLAKTYGSYHGKDVDPGTLRRAAAELAKEQRALASSKKTGEVIRLSTKVPTWQQFIEDVERERLTYNAQHRHRGNPKHTSGPLAGKHMTPQEAWDAMLAPELQVRLSPMELRMIFMPATMRTARRGEVKFLNQVYASTELMTVDGKAVRVQYDIHDPSFVLVFTPEGKFVCEAKWNANKVDYFPKPVVQMAREKRVDARIKRLQGHMDMAARELQPTHAAGNVFSLPEPVAPVVLVPSADSLADTPSIRDSQEQQVAQAPAGRPFFETDSDRYEWLMQHRDRWEDHDSSWTEAYVNSEGYADLREYFAGRGLLWEDGEDVFKSAR